MLEASLSTCSREMCDELCRALAQASRCYQSAAERESIAARSSDVIRGVTGSWLQWFSTMAPQRQLPIPVLQAPILGGDPIVSEYAGCVRRCMHLRRQQCRLIAIMRRIAAAARVGEACSMLQEKIVFA